MANSTDAGEEALRCLKATYQPSFLAPNPALSETARAASRHLFSALRPFCPKSPLDQLFVEGFDAEQIWQQIDLQTQPLLSSLRRQVKHFAKNPEEISQLKVVSLGKKAEEKERETWDEESDGFDEELEDEEGAEKEEKGGEDGMEEEEEQQGGESGSEEESEEEGEDEEGGGIEDKFLKIDELAKYLEKEEENFENAEVDKRGKKDADDEEDTEYEDDDDDGEEEESDEAAEFRFGDDDHEDEEAEDMENARCLFFSLHSEPK